MERRDFRVSVLVRYFLTFFAPLILLIIIATVLYLYFVEKSETELIQNNERQYLLLQKELVASSLSDGLEELLHLSELPTTKNLIQCKRSAENIASSQSAITSFINRKPLYIEASILLQDGTTLIKAESDNGIIKADSFKAFKSTVISGNAQDHGAG